MKVGDEYMVIVICLAAVVVILVLGLLFYRTSGEGVRNGRRDMPAAKSSIEDQKHRGTGIN